ncbi:unknown [Prevotella sp. CAG:755]|nr:unknown [Prevotella sp. CAG:755]
MKRKKVRVCQNLGTVAKAQRLLWKCEQDRARFKRLYVGEKIEHEKAVRRLKMEIEHTGYYSDCEEFLHFALIETKSLNKEGIDGKLKAYREFQKRAFADYMAKKEKLNKVEAEVFGKYIVAYADR